MTEFKIGDRVKIIKRPFDYVGIVGEEVTLKENIGGYWTALYKDEEYWFLPKELELIQTLRRDETEKV